MVEGTSKTIYRPGLSNLSTEYAPEWNQTTPSDTNPNPATMGPHRGGEPTDQQRAMATAGADYQKEIGYEAKGDWRHERQWGAAMDRAMQKYWHSQASKPEADDFIQSEAHDMGISVGELVRQLGPGFVEHYRQLPGTGRLQLGEGNAAFRGMAEKNEPGQSILSPPGNPGDLGDWWAGELDR